MTSTTEAGGYAAAEDCPSAWPIRLLLRLLLHLLLHLLLLILLLLLQQQR